MANIQTDRLEMYYERAGAGPPLLYISGTGGDLRAKPNIFDSILPQHFDVLAYDQRGLGRTERPPGPYSMQDYADDAAALLDAVGWARCLIMGVSFGGMVVQEFAVRHAERVERLVLACTSSGGEGGASYPLHELEGLSIPERARKMIGLNDSRFSAMEHDNPERFARITQTTIDGMVAAAGWPDDSPSHDNVLPEEGARFQLEARQGHDTWSRLASLSMPVLVCGGKYDLIAPPENSIALASQIPAARLQMYEGGHLFMVQDRAAFPAMVEFLGSA